jgi:hypothetical protein
MSLGKLHKWWKISPLCELPTVAHSTHTRCGGCSRVFRSRRRAVNMQSDAPVILHTARTSQKAPSFRSGSDSLCYSQRQNYVVYTRVQIKYNNGWYSYFLFPPAGPLSLSLFYFFPPTSPLLFVSIVFQIWGRPTHMFHMHSHAAPSASLSVHYRYRAAKNCSTQWPWQLCDGHCVLLHCCSYITTGCYK